MDVFYTYTYGTAAWLSVQGFLLLASPKMTVTMLLDETRPPSSIEIYLSRCSGLSLLTLAILTILLTGSVPLTSTANRPVTTNDNDPKAPYAVPTMLITTIFHGISGFYAYTWFTTSGQAAFALGMAGYALVGAVGLWCLLFASEHGKISRKTGVDKRTSGFPFENKEADKRFESKKGL
ncbi:hypothetical protein DTO166G4_7321 [Paecilomyces variotii]|uniref:Uncharacterized protein n=1 Tax=Byssochlamys spectabilis TaxID=264951 RepID=A0A443HRT0_BYSSP|nr:hypothetical protein C8Q69DRAFT_294887 [Paecilomyces variotii]KAJ9199045.1 hypothetical protein DTO164E3_4749 [Paecilomyces variotii]KAJ9211030.1 hypothetical protein DTO166G4_7321 [Paecilomyces variotii]KAJ9227813.1 hypothetical protein DTO166G5_9133 [Paecilomyces variotii]KAJ9251266.1 hypothetical protein DTO195F2_7901 [Paecilomyces variotii]KAJ9257432.1 hypothetical protein DTO207G8_2186 [Paecilomyces variotii]